MSETDSDIPYGEDFHDSQIARNWADRASEKRPWRVDFFKQFADAVAKSAILRPRVLELGAGPGFLAEFVLDHCPSVVDYTLLDFALPMLQLSRDRLQHYSLRTSFVQADFKSPIWPEQLSGAFDFVFSMQAVHELRHKRHAARFYAQVRAVLSEGGIFLVCDHLPGNEPTPTRAALFMTADENREALAAAGFQRFQCVDEHHSMALFCACD